MCDGDTNNCDEKLIVQRKKKYRVVEAMPSPTSPSKNACNNCASASSFPMGKSRVRQKRNFIMCIWTVVFIYFSISAELQNRAVAKTLPEADYPGKILQSTDDPRAINSPNQIYPTKSAKSAAFNSNPLQLSSIGPILLKSNIDDDSLTLDSSISNDNDTGRKQADDEQPGLTCTPPGIDDFPPDLFTQAQRQQGYVIVHFLVSLYIFYALALICDDYFVPSMECICDGLKMPTDVAGATFMAIATSAPELFTNIIGTFITQGDIGIGTIVGSAVFNILAVAAVCGIGAGMVVPLEWFSVTRDCLCYSLSVILLLVVLRDERIYWYEALVLVLVYSLYILAMYKNTTLKQGAERLVKHVEKKLGNGQTETTYTMKENGNGNHLDLDQVGETKEQRDETLIANALKNLQAEAEAEKEESGLFKPPCGQGCRAWCEWFLSWPVRALYAVSVPDCREAKWRKWYPLTFFMCVVWIGIEAYLVNWMMTVIGHTLKIPDSIMGLTFIAAGTSVPECVSSIIVARQGLGSMALSNSIGSNTFDILMCLGLPWLIRGAMIANDPERDYIQINSLGLEYSTMMLITSLIVLYTILAINKFVLDKRVGFLSLCLYGCFLVMASLFELNVFFRVNLETCVNHDDPI